MPFHRSDFTQWVPIYRGSESVVYDAQQDSLNRTVVLKENSHGNHTRFKMEAEVLAPLNHPNIQRVFDFGEEEGSYFIVVEKVPGVSLAQIGKLPESVALDIFIHIVEGVQYLHSQGYLHCDLKPGNIMISHSLKPIIVDFGMVEKIGTSVSGIQGSPRYLSPEQIQEKTLTVQSDIYSLGALLYHMLTGSHLYSQDSFEHIVDAIVNDQRDTSGVAKWWHTIFEKSLESNNDIRFDDTEELLEHLEILKAHFQGQLDFAVVASDRANLKHSITSMYQKVRVDCYQKQIAVLQNKSSYSDAHQLLKTLVQEEPHNSAIVSQLIDISQKVNQQINHAKGGTQNSSTANIGRLIVVSILFIIVGVGVLIYLNDAPLVQPSKKETGLDQSQFEKRFNAKKGTMPELNIPRKEDSLDTIKRTLRDSISDLNQIPEGQND
ncbi:MAG: serine/threonine protein kinase [Fibrobacterales bacterium]